MYRAWDTSPTPTAFCLLELLNSELENIYFQAISNHFPFLDVAEMFF